MIKTLRITSIIAAIAATVLLILPAVYGVRSDPKIEEFLKLAGKVEKFTATKGQNSAKKDTETSPLVKAATDYHLILDPPPPPPPKVAPGAAPQAAAVPAPPVVTAKFDLVATSYYASHPEQSFVLIDEPGKGLHWVKQGSAVGHLTIETVKDGAIVVRDGQRTSEMTVKVQESWRNLLKNPPPKTGPSSSSASPAAQALTGHPGSESSTHPSPVTANRPGAASLPNRRNPRQGATPSSAERITAAIPPTPADTQPSPAVEIAPPATTAQQVAAQPASQTATGDESGVELSPREKEIKAKIDKLNAEMKSSKNDEEIMTKMTELSKLFEQLKSTNSPDINK